MKATADKSTASHATPTPSRNPFFGKSGSVDFFEPSAKINPGIQPKLKINQSDDKWEQEADRMSEQLTQSPEETVATETVQRKESENLLSAQWPINPTADMNTAIKQKIQQETTGSQSLPRSIRPRMESHFGVDFGAIRIHSNQESTALSHQLGAKAFTYQNHLFFNRDLYRPDTLEGRKLLAHELTHVVQQGAADSMVQPGAPSIHLTVSKLPTTTENVPSQEKISISKKTTQLKKAKPAPSGEPAEKIEVVEAIQTVKATPATSKEDPEFQETITQLKQSRNAQKKHPEPEDKQGQVKSAAMLPVGEQKQYNDRKTHLNAIDQTASKEKGTKRFKAETFKALLNTELSKLESKLPHSESAAAQFKKDKPLEQVREGISGQVNNENKKVAAPITDQTAQPMPPDSGIASQTPGDLQKDPLGNRPKPINPEAASPKPKQEEEISMEKESRSLDELMDESKLSDEQLANSNEPDFIQALDSKKEAQTKAAEVPVQYRAQETVTLSKAQTSAKITAQRGLNGMVGHRDQSFVAVLGKQTDTKKNDLTEQNRVKDNLKRIYEATKTDVNKIFADLTTNEQSPTNVNKIFNDKSAAAKDVFEKRVEDQLDDIHGLGVKDFFFGEDTEAIEGVFKREKATFLASMDAALNEISGIIATQLNAAIDRIQKGREEAETFYSSLSTEQQRLSGEAMEQFRTQYADLESSVDDKQAELASSLAESYKENVDSLRATFDKLEEEASKNFLQKAADFVIGVAKAVYNLGKLLLSIVTRIASIIDEILSHPIRFLENLGAGIKQGFATFVENFDTYLLKGFFDWLRGSMGNAGIQLPAKLDEKGLFSLAIQLVGLNYETFREVVIRKLGADGEKIVVMLEKGEELLGEATALFKILKAEGIGGLWTHLKEMILSHLTEIFDRIKETVLYETIKKALLFVASMFNPIGAFIKAVQALYAGLKFLMDNIERIAILVNSFLDSLEMAVKGNVSGIAGKIITALSTFIVMAIDFLAKLLGLGNLGEKVRKIIQVFRNPVIRAMEWVVDKIVKPVVTTLAKAGKGLIKMIMPKTLGETVPFSTPKHSHKLYIVQNGSSYRVIVESTPQTVRDQLAEWRTELDKDEWKARSTTRGVIREKIRKVEKDLGVVEEQTKIVEDQVIKKQPINDKLLKNAEGRLSDSLKAVFIEFDQFADDKDKSTDFKVVFAANLMNVHPTAKLVVDTAVDKISKNNKAKGFAEIREWSGLLNFIIDTEPAKSLYAKPMGSKNAAGYPGHAYKQVVDNASKATLLKGEPQEKIDKVTKDVVNSVAQGTQVFFALRDQIFDKNSKNIVDEKIVALYNSQSPHTRYYPDDIDFRVEGDEFVISYKYKSEPGEKSPVFTVRFKAEKVKGGRKITQKVTGENLVLKDPGSRGVTHTVYKEAYVNQPLKLNSAHIIADRFMGSGYKQGLNLIATSDEFNKQDMARSEDRIANKVLEVQNKKENENKIVSFTLTVTATWQSYDDKQVLTVFDTLDSKLSKEELEVIADKLAKRQDPRRCESVVYDTSIFVDSKAYSTLPQIEIGPDKYLKIP